MTSHKKSPEADLRIKVIEALKTDPNLYGEVYDNCSSIEFGIDLTFERKDAFGVPRLYGVQIKAGDLKPRKERGSQSKSIRELLGQVIIAFGHRFQPHDKLLDGVYVIIGGKISPHARQYIASSYVGFRQIYVLDNNELERFFLLAAARTNSLKEA